MVFAELVTLANDLSARLAQAGAGPDIPVPLIVGRNAELVVGILGILGAGAAFAPIDVRDPVERIASLTRQLDAPIAVVGSTTPQSVVDTLGVTTPALHPVGPTSDWSPLPVSPEHLAYLMFTSGSTGEPKGVMIEHGSLEAYLRHALGNYVTVGLNGAPLLTSHAFDLALTSLLVPLLAGQPVHLFPSDADFYELASLLASGGPYSFVKLTPAHLGPLASALIDVSGTLQTHRIIVGGDRLLWEQLIQWERLAPGAEIINEYGPTEATVGNITSIVHPSDGASGSVPIGHPIAGTRVVVGSPEKPASEGTAAELWMSGESLARGYYRDPTMTGAKFREYDGRRWYRTGDLARMLEGGALDYIGRLDDQVKVHGYRIELGEVEAACQSLPIVRDVAVALEDDHLVAYVVPSHSDIQTSGLRDGLRDLLPLYMLPTEVVCLKELPISNNGKVLRGSLADFRPYSDNAVGDSPDVSLAPMQRWLLDRTLRNASYWNQAVVLQLDHAIDEIIVHQAIAHVFSQHESFRSRFSKSGRRWHQRVEDRLVVPDTERWDLTGLNSAQQEAEFLRRSTLLHGTLNLAKGPVFRAALANMGAGQPALLLLTAHHLVVDAVSWNILTDDLADTVESLLDGRAPQSRPGFPFSLWSRSLASRYANSEDERRYWLESVPPATQRWPTAVGADCSEAGACHYFTTLDRAITERISHNFSLRSGSTVESILLAALTRAVSSWTKSNGMFVDIESHGRHDLEEDLSRSIGWYTALYPVWLPCLASNEDIGGYVTSTAQVLAGVPNKGSGFGVLKYVMNDPDILALPEPDILFNYLGRQVMPAGSRISWSEQPVGRVRDGTAPRTHLLEITARISQGALGVQWTYSPDIHTELEIAAAASALNHDLSDLATSPMAAGGEEALRLSSALVAPVNETQNLIANIWCDVLKLEQVGINDDFFEVGGDSLIMMQIVSRLRRTFGCRVPLTAMFDQPTVEDLAAKIEAVVAGRDVF